MKRWRTIRFRHWGIIMPVISLILLCGIGAWTVLSWSGLLNLGRIVTWSTVRQNSGVFRLAWSPDAKTIASIEGTGVEFRYFICMRRVADGTLMYPCTTLDTFVESLMFNRDGSVLATGNRQGLIQLWSVRDGELLRTLDSEVEKPDNWIRGLAWRKDNSVLTSTVGNMIQAWDTKIGQRISTVTLENNAGTPVLGPSSTLVTGWTNVDKTVFVRRANTGEVISTIKMDRDPQPTLSGSPPLLLSPDEAFVASRDLDEVIRVWRINDSTLQASMKGHTDIVHSFAFSPDGQTLASASGESLILFTEHNGDRTVRLWRTRDGKQIDVLLVWGGPVVAMVWSPNGEQLAIASGDKIHLWQVK